LIGSARVTGTTDEKRHQQVTKNSQNNQIKKKLRTLQSMKIAVDSFVLREKEETLIIEENKSKEQGEVLKLDLS
jgi:hypothetical protein